ncbi:hypothetical protein IWZ03DRAFT_123678 [Phyllosticta citriasiana]|uniref:Uncharacterized protein n=1 Tax=Phyllosticta citriasiana TaxID=595635 RepID=A0ABR1K9I2_9PEZI
MNGGTFIYKCRHVRIQKAQYLLRRWKMHLIFLTPSSSTLLQPCQPSQAKALQAQWHIHIFSAHPLSFGQAKRATVVTARPSVVHATPKMPTHPACDAAGWAPTAHTGVRLCETANDDAIALPRRRRPHCRRPPSLVPHPVAATLHHASALALWQTLRTPTETASESPRARSWTQPRRMDRRGTTTRKTRTSCCPISRPTLLTLPTLRAWTSFGLLRPRQTVPPLRWSRSSRLSTRRRRLGTWTRWIWTTHVRSRTSRPKPQSLSTGHLTTFPTRRRRRRRRGRWQTPTSSPMATRSISKRRTRALRPLSRTQTISAAYPARRRISSTR